MVVKSCFGIVVEIKIRCFFLTHKDDDKLSGFHGIFPFSFLNFILPKNVSKWWWFHFSC